MLGYVLFLLPSFLSSFLFPPSLSSTPLPYPLLTTPCRYLSLLSLVDLNSTVHRHFPSRTTCKSMRLVWMRRGLPTCMRAIVLWLFMIITACFTILTLGVGQTWIAVRWLWHVCVAWRWFRGWSSIRSLLRRNRIREKFVGAGAAFDGWPLLENGASLVVLRCLFSYLYFTKCFDYG